MGYPEKKTGGSLMVSREAVLTMSTPLMLIVFATSFRRQGFGRSDDQDHGFGWRWRGFHSVHLVVQVQDCMRGVTGEIE